MISTLDFTTLPSRQQLQLLCKAVSVLDAIICQEWEFRYYSYNSKWSEAEEFCEIRNGQGDHTLILFHPQGCIINGLAHEYLPKEKSKLTNRLPEIYHEFMYGEPVNSIGTTFCLWTNEEQKWQVGDIADYRDGSQEILEIFDGNPKTYINWAKDYFEDSFLENESTEHIVTAVYRGQTLTKEMVLGLTNEIRDWRQLENDLQEINYPKSF
jgi:hypothetical protein